MAVAANAAAPQEEEQNLSEMKSGHSRGQWSGCQLQRRSHTQHTHNTEVREREGTGMGARTQKIALAASTVLCMKCPFVGKMPC
jgi:hypothetical protein